MFWGSLASSILVGGFVGCVVFFFVWQVTEVFALRFIAFLVGITLISIIRVVILVRFRGTYYKAFYRMKPARANIGNLFLEAATFGLSVGFIIMRVLKLILAASMFIGRIDRPFLAPGVGNLWGYFELDAYPTIYQVRHIMFGTDDDVSLSQSNIEHPAFLFSRAAIFLFCCNISATFYFTRRTDIH